MTSNLELPDGRVIAVAADMLALGLERAAVFAGHQAAKRQIRAAKELPRLTIEQVAATVSASADVQPPEPADAARHAPNCGYRRNWACSCGAMP